MRAEKFLDRLTIIAASLVGAYYLIYLVLCLAGFDSKLMAIFALFVMAVALLPVVFREKIKKRLKRAFKPTQIVFTSLLCV